MKLTTQLKPKIRRLLQLTILQLMLVTIFSSLANGHNLTGQEIFNKPLTLELKAVKMKQVLREIEKQTDARFIYSASATPNNPSVSKSEPKPPQTIRGIVADEQNVPLPGVGVQIKGTQEGTLTDVSGAYEIVVPDGNAVLVFSFIGYEKQEIVVGTQTTINVTMKVSSQELEEVVVIGYGSVRKKDLTGSVASIKGKALTDVPVSSADQVLQGRVAGVQVTQSSAAPGGGLSIRIRGSNSINAGNEPLYVIDGYPVYSDNNITPTGVGERVGGNALSLINTNDIESIEILKDASAAAIYGARGANGVVLITTKRGKEGQNKISINSYYGTQEVINQYSLANNTQLAGFANGYGQSLTPPVTPYPTVPSTNTDWQNEVFQTGNVQNHTLTFSGGNGGTNYLISADYYGEKGAVIGSGFDRGSFRFNLDKIVSSKLTLGNSLTISRSSRDVRDILPQTLASRPFSPVFRSDGTYHLESVASFGGQPSRVDNPVALGKLITDKTIVSRAIGNIYGEYQISNALSAKVVIGADASYLSGRGYLPRTTIAGLDEQGLANLSSVENISWLNENTITYKKTIGEKHNLSILVGNSFQRQKVLNYGIRRSGFPTDVTSFYVVTRGANDRTYIPSGSFDFAINSFFGRINYALDDKYLFTFTARADGSSKFGEGNKYGFFPSGAFAWRVSDENFMQNIQQVSNLKLRTSYGITGNQELPPYRSLARLVADGGQIIGGQQVTGFTSSSDMPNPNLTWEQTAQFNVGLDLGLFADRVTITADYYQKTTSDLLFQSPVPVETGFSTQWQNIGKVRNSGFEFSINTENVRSKSFTWNTSFNVSANRNEVLELDPNSSPNSDGSRQLLVSLFQNTAGGVDGLGIIKTGESIGSFHTHVHDGIWQSQEEITAAGAGFSAYKPGDFKYKDLNKDGKIDGNDRMITGNGIPELIYGINNDFTFKNFDLTILIQGVADVDVINLTRYNLENSIGATNTTAERATEFWGGANKSSTYSRPGPTDFFLTDRFVENGAFLRLRTVSLGYNLPLSKWKQKVISGLRVYLTGQNLVTISDYSGFDPEVNAAGQAQVFQGVDLFSYPVQRRFLFGINVSF